MRQLTETEVCKLLSANLILTRLRKVGVRLLHLPRLRVVHRVGHRQNSEFLPSWWPIRSSSLFYFRHLHSSFPYIPFCRRARKRPIGLACSFVCRFSPVFYRQEGGSHYSFASSYCQVSRRLMAELIIPARALSSSSLTINPTSLIKLIRSFSGRSRRPLDLLSAPLEWRLI